jgi:hypothetical protein
MELEEAFRVIRLSLLNPPDRLPKLRKEWQDLAVAQGEAKGEEILLLIQKRKEVEKEVERLVEQRGLTSCPLHTEKPNIFGCAICKRRRRKRDLAAEGRAL